MKLSVYVAARFPHKPQALGLRGVLLGSGFEVTSRWVFEPWETDGHLPHEERAMRASMDFEDIRKADVVVLYNPVEAARVGTGGCHVETGYALALGKPILVLGPPSNVFHHLPEVACFATEDALIEGLRAQETIKNQRRQNQASFHPKRSG